MEQNRAKFVHGTLDMLVLVAVGAGEFHGPGIARRVEQNIRDTFKVRPGSLSAALHRMEEAGWRSSAWGEWENNRRARYYRRTKAGERQLGVEAVQWNTIFCAIASTLSESEEVI